ncbi:MAG: cupin domain-containing protein [Desulfobacteraceae bacterium]|nr:cupin domain-containing protein [Desulfobacteraceae bacterium]
MADKGTQLIKNIPFSTPVDIVDLVDYEEGRVVSRTLSSKPHINITLFAFDKDEEISAHTSPGDAMVQVLDGEALINIDGEKIKAVQGQVVVMPANVPHAVSASSQFKMLLTVVKQPVSIGGM